MGHTVDTVIHTFWAEFLKLAREGRPEDYQILAMLTIAIVR